MPLLILTPKTCLNLTLKPQMCIGEATKEIFLFKSRKRTVTILHESVYGKIKQNLLFGTLDGFRAIILDRVASLLVRARGSTNSSREEGQTNP